jgi:hypothetical protein
VRLFVLTAYDNIKMIGNIFRKILIVLLVIVPVFSDSGCKKQAKCGCNGDVLYSLTNERATVSYTSGASIQFMTLVDPYSTYNFCNPGEMFPKFANFKSGDILEITGKVYWECNFLYQSSNSSYQSVYKVYMCQVSDVTVNPYGK